MIWKIEEKQFNIDYENCFPFDWYLFYGVRVCGDERRRKAMH